MITANLAGTQTHLRCEREKYSHSRLNLNEDNSDSASKQNQEDLGDWNPNDTNSDKDAEKLTEICAKKCSHYKAWLIFGCCSLVVIGAIVLIVLLGAGVISTNS